MEGPYEDYKDPDKVAAILGGWVTRASNICQYRLEALDLDKKKYKDVLKAFTLYLQPSQTTMHTWYQIGNITLHSARIKQNHDQTQRP